MNAYYKLIDQTAVDGNAHLPWNIGSGSDEGDEGLGFDIAPESKTRIIFHRINGECESTAEKLFSATAGAKIWASCVAMRLNRDVRDRLFRQLDNLHDADEWFEGDAPVDLASFKCFVRAILLGVISGKPGLSLTPQGNLIAIWSDESGKLAIEFQPGDAIRYLWTQKIDGDVERATGISTIRRLPVVLSPLELKNWFSGS